MTDLEIEIVCFVNELHRKHVYRYEQYQMLHNVKYTKNLERNYIELIRKKYKGNCFEVAYELKSYYLENNILSNTIILKMRPESPEIQEFRCIKVYSDADDKVHEYSHHAIEIFKEHGRYKVLDILHTDKVLWLENYLDEICKINNCKREQLRYDMGYLVPCHVYADNMQELSALMKYLDNKYCIGKPRLTLANIDDSEGMILSDDIFMNFDEIYRPFKVDYETLKRSWVKVYDKLMKIRFNMLYMMCSGNGRKNYGVSDVIAETLLDDARIIEDGYTLEVWSKERGE